VTRHSHQDALDEPTYERLLDATAKLRQPYESECFTVLILAGRLGMRAGEIAHLAEEWVDWDRNIIEIPQWDPCDGGYCRQQAMQAVGNHENLTLDEAMQQRWEPKTSGSARPIPFDFSDRVLACVEAFFEDHDEWPHSRASVNRRVDRAAEAADMDPSSIYPHALRATAATFHAYRGLAAVPLQSLMGWAQLSTAQKYIRLSGGATAKALRDVHSE
jgi:integrase